MNLYCAEVIARSAQNIWDLMSMLRLDLVVIQKH